MLYVRASPNDQIRLLAEFTRIGIYGRADGRILNGSKRAGGLRKDPQLVHSTTFQVKTRAVVTDRHLGGECLIRGAPFLEKACRPAVFNRNPLVTV